MTDAGSEPIILARHAGNALPPPATRIAQLIPGFFSPTNDPDQSDGDS